MFIGLKKKRMYDDIATSVSIETVSIIVITAGIHNNPYL